MNYKETHVLYLLITFTFSNHYLNFSHVEKIISLSIRHINTEKYYI